MSRELRVYAGCPLGTGPERPARGGDDAFLEQIASKKAPVAIESIIDQEVARILDSEPHSGESVQRSFDRKESELRSLFTSLTKDEAADLFVRLSNSNAKSLARLTADRRGRLMTCLTTVSKARGGQQ